MASSLQHSSRKFTMLDTRNTELEQSQEPLRAFVKPTLLVIDDSQDLSFWMQSPVQEHYKVRLANGGYKGLHAAQEQP
jgi:hypothetical protein